MVAAMMMVSSVSLAHSQVSIFGVKDKTTPFPLKFTVGGKTVDAEYDTDGVTTFSFEDAKKFGLLNDDGTPKETPTGEGAIRGVGSTGIKTYIFSVSLTVQGAAAGGGVSKPAGPKGTETVEVQVPQRSANQEGTAEEKERKTSAVPTLLGKEHAAMEWGGKRIQIIDRPVPGAPLTDVRASVLADAQPGPVVPIQLVPDTRIFGALIAGVLADPRVTFLPTTIVSSDFARGIGLTPVGIASVDPETLGAWYLHGFISTLPGSSSVDLPFGLLDVVLPSTGGPIVFNDVAAYISDEVDGVVLGGNSLLPEGYAGYLDGAGLHLVAPEPGTLTLIGTGMVGLAALMRRRRRSARSEA